MATREMTSASSLVGAVEEEEIPGAQPSSCMCGCLKPPPVPMAAKAFAWEKLTSHSCLLLSPQGHEIGKGLAALAVGTKL